MKTFFNTFAHVLFCIIVCVTLFLAFAMVYYFLAPKSINMSEVTPWEYIKAFPFEKSIFLGIFSSLCGVILTFYIVRPCFQLSDTLAWDNNNRLRLQITNRLWFSDLSSVSVEMYFVRIDNKSQDVKYMRIPMNEDTISIIRGKIYRVESSNHIVHTKSGFVWDGRYENIRCRVIATHSITGVTRVVDKEYKKEDIVRGVFKKGEFVDYELRYPTTCWKTWRMEIHERCNRLWEFNEHVLRVIRPIQNVDEVSTDDYKKVLEDLEKFSTKHYQDMYPCILTNSDTIMFMKTEITKLKEMSLLNLNPDNKEKRNMITVNLNKYLVFISSKMDDDIWNYYLDDIKSA